MSATDENVLSESPNTNKLPEIPPATTLLRAKTISEINGTSNSNGDAEELMCTQLKRKIPIQLTEGAQSTEEDAQDASATKRRRTFEEPAAGTITNAEQGNNHTNDDTPAATSLDSTVDEVTVKCEPVEPDQPAASSSTNAEKVNNNTNDDTPAAATSDSTADDVTVKCEPIEPNQGEQATPDGNEPDQSTPSDDDVQRPSSSGTINPVDVKPAIKVEKADASSTSRETCKFGIRCYRRNPMHRIEEAHPGDPDYKRPSFPPPPKGTPDCPFGNLCYRRNPVHFQQYNHPLDTDFQQNYKNYRMRLRQRRQQNTSDATGGNSSDLDDYDLDDPFIDDGDDDDDYVPSNDEEDTEEFGADYDDGDKVEE